MLKKLKVIGYFCSVFAFLIFLESIDFQNQGILAKDNNQLISTTDRVNNPRRLLERGIQLYDTESFTLARDAWLQSALLYSQQQDVLGEALALNNLALAHQKLAEWEQSELAIAKSLELLKDSDNLANKAGYWEIKGKVANTQGNWQWKTGKIELALSTWQNATDYYTRGDDRLGIIKTQINQAKALQALGFTVRAIKLLTTVNNSLQQESNPALKATGLRYLGIGYRNLGNLERSTKLLEQSIKLDRRSQKVNFTWLELGNTYRKQRDRLLTVGKQAAAEKYFNLAMQAYSMGQKASSLSLSSELNRLSLLVEGGKYAEAKALIGEFSFPNDLKANRSNIYALLNYANSLTCLRAETSNPSNFNFGTDNHSCNYPYSLATPANFPTADIITLIKKAIAQSRQIQDPIAETQALSQLAVIYELNGDLNQAKQINQQGLLLLEGKPAANIKYQLQWQLGRTLQKEGNHELAKISYSQAIASLEEVRGNILLIDPQVQFSFRDRVEPVYREYADLLLTTSQNNPPSQDNLRQAIRAIDALQLAELENFLGCNLSRLVKIDETTVDPNAAQIYPIVLSDRIATILDIPGKPLTYRETKVSQQQVSNAIFTLQDNLTQPGKTPEVLEQARQVYQWLIAPNQSLLEENPQIKTLVFVPDSLLRNIPFGILYDGKQYLIEKDYALVISPQLELFAPSPSTEPLKVLTGGVEISQTIEGIKFPAIAEVAQELRQIRTNTSENNPLLNEAFTETNIKQQLQQEDFSAIHWKTHGIFSSDPAETFLVAYQDSIKANELESLVQTASQDGQKPLELLVLSACETARGDKRAILGLAGLTVRTGARTALSTLWRAEDRATTLLMTRFYQQLERPGITKAEALRQAQLSLMNEEGYFAPYYWGTYLLVGNWL